MITRVLWACLFGLAVIFFIGTAFAQDRDQIKLADLNHLIDQTNFIVGQGCSGTLISTEHRLVLTAFHCVSGNIRVVEREERGADGVMKKVRREQTDRITIQQRDYRRHEQVGAIAYQTTILAHRKERDLALLQLVADNLRSSVHAQVLPEDMEVIRGDTVTAVGNPRGLDSSLTRGVVSSTSRSFKMTWTGPDEVPLIQFDAAASPGSSGGALYDSTGHLIGVTVAGIPGEMALAIPVADVRALLRDYCFAGVFDTKADDATCRAPLNDTKVVEVETDAEAD